MPDSSDQNNKKTIKVIVEGEATADGTITGGENVKIMVDKDEFEGDDAVDEALKKLNPAAAVNPDGNSSSAAADPPVIPSTDNDSNAATDANREDIEKMLEAAIKELDQAKNGFDVVSSASSDEERIKRTQENLNKKKAVVADLEEQLRKITEKESKSRTQNELENMNVPEDRQKAAQDAANAASKMDVGGGGRTRAKRRRPKRTGTKKKKRTKRQRKKGRKTKKQ